MSKECRRQTAGTLIGVGFVTPGVVWYWGLSPAWLLLTVVCLTAGYVATPDPRDDSADA